MNEAFLVGLGALITAVPGAVGAALAVLAKYREGQLKSHLEAEKTRRDATLAEWQQIWDRQREMAEEETQRFVVRLNEMGAQIQRLERVNAELQRALAEVHAEHRNCLTEISEVYLWLGRYHDALVQRDKVLKRHGEELDPVPPPPVRRSTGERADFLMRTVGQDILLTAAVTPKPPPGPPVVPPGSGGARP